MKITSIGTKSMALLGLLFFMQHTVLAQKKNWVKIPDPKFLGYLQQKIPEAFKGDKMDANSPAVAQLTRINVINLKVNSFEGIGYFKGLEEFNCTYNLAETLDLSQNTKLKYLVCWENRLTSLDVSSNTALRILNCGDNQITSLTLGNKPELRELYCEYNKIGSLDMEQSPNLEAFYAVSNQLKNIDLSQNEKLAKLELAENPLGNVRPAPIMISIPDTQFKKALQERIPNAFVGDYLNTQHNDVVYLKSLVLANKGIASLKGISYFKGLENLDCAQNGLTQLDLSQNTQLTNLEISGNPIKTLDLRGMRYLDHLTYLGQFAQLSELALHWRLRDNAMVQELKRARGNNLLITVYTASAASVAYIPLNGNDTPLPMDDKYRNGSKWPGIKKGD